MRYSRSCVASRRMVAPRVCHADDDPGDRRRGQHEDHVRHRRADRQDRGRRRLDARHGRRRSRRAWSRAACSRTSRCSTSRSTRRRARPHARPGQALVGDRAGVLHPADEHRRRRRVRREQPVRPEPEAAALRADRDRRLVLHRRVGRAVDRAARGSTRSSTRIDKHSRNIEYAPPTEVHLDNPLAVRRSRTSTTTTRAFGSASSCLAACKLDTRLRGAHVSLQPRRARQPATTRTSRSAMSARPTPTSRPGAGQGRLGRLERDHADDRSPRELVRHRRAATSTRCRSSTRCRRSARTSTTTSSTRRAFKAWQILERHNLVVEGAPRRRPPHAVPAGVHDRRHVDARLAQQPVPRRLPRARQPRVLVAAVRRSTGSASAASAFWDSAYTTFITTDNPRAQLPARQRTPRGLDAVQELGRRRHAAATCGRSCCRCSASISGMVSKLVTSRSISRSASTD